jgi:MFS family permease
VLTADPGPPDRLVDRSAKPQRPVRAKARHSAWKAMSYPGFRLYFAGSLISNLGTWMQTTAQVVLMYQLTHSVFAVGVVTSAQFAGFLVLGPWAAVVASRVGRRRMLILTQLTSAGVAGLLATLAAVGSLGENGLIAGALGTGLLFTFALPVQTALVARLVPDSQRNTEAAMAMNSVSYNVGRALAPVLCIAVIATIGFTWAFALNAVSFVIFAATLARVRLRDPDETIQDRRIKNRSTDNRSIKDGYRATLQRPRILLLLAMVAAVTFADDPVLILGPALARHALHGSNALPGYFLSALGLGTVLGSLRPARDPRSWDESRTSRRAAGWLLFLAAAIVFFALGRSTFLCCVAAFAAGVAALNTGAVTQTQLVRLQPRYATSVMALWAVCWAGTKPIASLADGWLASHAEYLWMAGGALCLPALCLAVAELTLPRSAKDRIVNPVRKRLASRVNALASAAGDLSVVTQQSLDDRQRHWRDESLLLRRKRPS